MGFHGALRRTGHLFRSFNTKGYGVHSPYFFDLINSLQRNKSKNRLVYNAVEARRDELLHDTREVWADDFGTGKSCYKRICDIASVSSVNQKYGALLGYFAARSGSGPIVELGTSLGIGTMYLAGANRAAPIVTVEGSEALAGIASAGFIKAGFENIEMITGRFDDHIERIIGRYSPPGLVFIDGNHRGEALARYFEAFAPAASEDTVIIADDIDYSPGMSAAWNRIKRDERVTATIDTGRMGLLFFRGDGSRRGYRIWY